MAVLTISLCHVVVAQQTKVEGWLGAGLQKDISKQFRIEGGLQLRMENQPEILKVAFSELGVLYKANKFLRFGIEYRLSITDTYFQNRLSGSTYLRYNAKPVRLTYRLKYELRMERFANNDHVIRNKIDINYKFNKRYSISTDGELFFRKNYKSGIFDTYRVGIGLSHTYKKRHELEVFYRFEQMFNVEAPDLSHIFGLRYSGTLKKKKKKHSENADDE